MLSARDKRHRPSWSNQRDLVSLNLPGVTGAAAVVVVACSSFLATYGRQRRSVNVGGPLVLRDADAARSAIAVCLVLGRRR